MKFHLDDGEIKLLQETEYKSLYPWFIQEFSKEGTACSNKVIPWKWSLGFRATALKYFRRFESSSGEEFIQATLQPDECYPRTKYSMFGTDRLIKEFSVTIHKLGDEETIEKCTAWGGVSSTYEIDFRSHTDNDSLLFSIYLRRENYDALCYFARQGGNQDEVFLSVSGVSGFYSGWSPEISTSSIKVLTSGQEQKVIRPEGYDEPPRLGKVSEFRLYFSRPTTLATPTKEDNDDEDDFAPPSSPAAPNVNLLEPIHKLQTTLEKLLVPLWIIVVLLAWMILR